MPIEGYEAPYAKAQMVFFNDSAVTPEAPASAEELLEFCKKYPRKVTYPALRTLPAAPLCATSSMSCAAGSSSRYGGRLRHRQGGHRACAGLSAGAQPLPLERGQDLSGILHHGGRDVRRRGAGNEHELRAVQRGNRIAEGTYTDTTRTFVFDNGTIGNTNYMAIAFNSPNKAERWWSSMPSSPPSCS